MTTENENPGAGTMAPAIPSRRNGSGFHLKSGTKEEFFEVTNTGIILRGKMPEENWLKLAEEAIGDFETGRDTHLATMFRVGDVLTYGEREYGETYAQAIDATRKAIRLSVKTLKNVAWICGSVKPQNRHEMLTLAHHEAVAKLKEEDQIRFLKLADDDELTVAELKKEVKKEFPPAPREGGKKKIVVDLEDEAGLQHATEKVLEFFGKEGTEAPENWPKERKARWFPTITRLFAYFATEEEISREALKEIATFLDSPDNNPLKGWKDKRKAKWAEQLNAVAKAGRRMGVTACGNGKKGGTAPEPTEPENEAPDEEQSDSSQAAERGADDGETGE